MIKRAARRAFTIAEIFIVFILLAITLTILYQMFYQQMLRATKVVMRAEGQQSVRLLLMRLRQELKRAIEPVQIDEKREKVTIPLEDWSKPNDDPERRYFMEYEYVPANTQITVRKLNRTKEVVEERIWLGGKSQITKFKIYDTGVNERILFQYYRVIVEVSHYEIKMRPELKDRQLSEEERKKEEVNLTTTVYPRRINMELRIEVPQVGGSEV